MGRGEDAGREPAKVVDPYRVRDEAGRRPRVHEYTLGRGLRHAWREARPTDRLFALLALATDTAVVEGCVMWLRSRRGPYGGSLVLHTWPHLDFVPFLTFALLAAAAAGTAVAALTARLPRTTLLQWTAAVALLVVALTLWPHRTPVYRSPGVPPPPASYSVLNSPRT